jgi:hypothetical protein
MGNLGQEITGDHFPPETTKLYIGAVWIGTVWQKSEVGSHHTTPFG